MLNRVNTVFNFSPYLHLRPALGVLSPKHGKGISGCPVKGTERLSPALEKVKRSRDTIINLSFETNRFGQTLL